MSLRSTLAGSLGAVALLATLGLAPSALADSGPSSPSSSGYDDNSAPTDTCSQTSVWESEPTVVEVPGEGEISAVEASAVPEC